MSDLANVNSTTSSVMSYKNRMSTLLNPKLGVFVSRPKYMWLSQAWLTNTQPPVKAKRSA